MLSKCLHCIAWESWFMILSVRFWHAIDLQFHLSLHHLQLEWACLCHQTLLFTSAQKDLRLEQIYLHGTGPPTYITWLDCSSCNAVVYEKHTKTIVLKTILAYIKPLSFHLNFPAKGDNAAGKDSALARTSEENRHGKIDCADHLRS